jgi:catechol 2,3-dioxygenase-like lactoylglutathione lyase family enzyme
MPLNGSAPMRVARPSRDLTKAREFWVGGLGLEVLWEHTSDGTPEDHSLLMVGWPTAAWHLELVNSPHQPIEPSPTPEDLLVIYLSGPVPDDVITRLEDHGGRRVPALNPYWDTWGVTIEDPDGYRLVLSSRTWSD